MRNRTTFVIAHRLSTVRAADQILVLEAGQVVAHGTHEQLLETSPLYRDTYALQLQTDDDPTGGQEGAANDTADAAALAERAAS
jgi:ABC-type transport system involved in cytochrome bd biosynthesis fused ATPase/permease subunit